VRIDRSDDIPLWPFVESDSLLHVILVVGPLEGQGMNGGCVEDMTCDFVRRVPNFFD